MVSWFAPVLDVDAIDEIASGDVGMIPFPSPRATGLRELPRRISFSCYNTQIHETSLTSDVA